MPTRDTSAPPISAFVVDGLGLNSRRAHAPRGTRGGRGLPNKCSACGSLNHIMSSCKASDDALLRWTLAKRKMIVQKYGTPGGSASPHTAMLSDVPTYDVDALPTLEDFTYECDDSEVSVPFNSIAFSSSLAPGRDLSQFLVVDSTCSIKLTAFRSDFVTFAPPSAPSRVGGVGVDVKGSGSMRISIRLAYGQAIHRTIHALYTPDLSFRSAISWSENGTSGKLRTTSYNHRRQPTYRRRLLSPKWQVNGLGRSGDCGHGRVGVGYE
jgi:hypothetical protein